MLNNLSISKKLYSGFGLVLLIIAVLVLTALRGFDQVSSSVKRNIHSYDVLNSSSSMLNSLVDIETAMRGFALTGQDSFLEPMNTGEEAFTDAYNRLKQATADNPQQQARLAGLQQLYQQWLQQDMQTSVNLRREVNADRAPLTTLVSQISSGQAKAKMDAMRAVINEFQAAEKSLQDERSLLMDQAKSTAFTILIAGGLVAAILAVLIATFLARTLTHRLGEAVALARNIADGRLDNTIAIEGKDEVSTLQQAFVAMQDRLRTMIGEIRASAEQLVGAADNISAASVQLSASAQEQSSSASSMAATVEELTVSINHVSDNAVEAHAQSSESGRQSSEGGSVIQETLARMNQIAQTVEASAGQISELDSHAEQISSIVSVISGIAEQTNLLALNAAIEAARAGEQGRGFAVVADEVRLLAQRTGNSTQEITEMVKRIQSGTRDAVGQMEVGVQQVKGGVTLAQQAGEAIVSIRQSSGDVVRMVDQISLALREQTAASQDVARNVERIAQMSQQNSQAVEQTAETAGALQRLAQGLYGQVGVFRI
ncbi:methyl-accepting chemotaxis protein [Pseudomonas juntendi]|uniref:methyl-accepting chemotaxis protein n=2 Tax=Pseudomonas TaxID=286 RepID=UPI00244A1294|nr:methyl-accepting chemotaxis protein [Pseudomonas juntendi]MDG9875306.1 methyl-accepting chemotaxis protein [Pseudomonas juntendi]